MTHIVILGSGFAAVAAVRELRKQKITAQISVISPKQELIYLPSLIWLPSGLRSANDLRQPLAQFFQCHQVNWIQGKVQQVLNGGRKVVTDNGEIDNDYLIIATGGRYIRKLPGIEHAFIPCEGIEPVEALTKRLNSLLSGTIAVGFGGNPKEPSAVRGGPMFEFIFGLDTLLRQQNRRDKFELIFFNPQEKPGKRLGEKAVDKILQRMAKQGIKTHLGHKPVRFEADKVITEGGEFAADLILFMPGLTGPAWLEGSELPQSEGGFIQADEYARVKGLTNTYVAGDAGSYPGPDWMAKQAHQADLQAVAIAKNIAAELKGQIGNTAFTAELACIIDAVDSGTLVYRRGNWNIVLPSMRILHWAKKRFEQLYLNKLR